MLSIIFVLCIYFFQNILASATIIHLITEFMVNGKKASPYYETNQPGQGYFIINSNINVVYSLRGFPMAQMVMSLLTVCENQVQSLGWEDPLEKDMATDSSILAWKIPWMEEPGRLQSMGLQTVRHF